MFYGGGTFSQLQIWERCRKKQCIWLRSQATKTHTERKQNWNGSKWNKPNFCYAEQSVFRAMFAIFLSHDSRSRIWVIRVAERLTLGDSVLRACCWNYDAILSGKLWDHNHISLVPYSRLTGALFWNTSYDSYPVHCPRLLGAHLHSQPSEWHAPCI